MRRWIPYLLAALILAACGLATFSVVRSQQNLLATNQATCRAQNEVRLAVRKVLFLARDSARAHLGGKDLEDAETFYSQALGLVVLHDCSKIGG